MAASSNTIYIVERLIATVGRAFYNDNVVIVLDALVREKFIRNEEIGPRLKLSGRDVRKILNLLESECLVKSEDLTMDDGKTSKCWYIDYQHFVYVVRFRIYLIQKELSTLETQEMNHLYFECPRCHQKYSELEAVRLRSKDGHFICSHCCPYEDFSTSISHESYRLIEFDNRSKLKEVQSFDKKLREQFKATEDHDGIYNLLAELKDVQIIRNRPSENIKRGIGGTKVTDEETKMEIAENSKIRSGGNSAVRAAKQGQSSSGGGVREGEFVLEITTDEAETVASRERNEYLAAAKRQKALPEHLQGSRVQLAVGIPSVSDMQDVRVSTSSVEIQIVQQQQVVGPDGDDDDVAWEDEAAETVGEAKQNGDNDAQENTDDVDWE